MVRNLGLALAGALVCAGLASAQGYAGKFTLPFEARWGQATLPAGDYKFTMDSVNGLARVKISRGTKGVALISSQSWSPVSPGRDTLTIVRNSNGNTVRDLSLPETGVAWHYAPHKAKSGSTAAGADAVPVPGRRDVLRTETWSEPPRRSAALRFRIGN
jgi:hypothetical protein